MLRYTSHLDLARIWERSFRRASVPLVYSQGFNPRPQIQIAAALPLGFTSECELIDLWTQADLGEPGAAVARIQAAVPGGITVHKLEGVPLKSPALQSVTTTASYRIVTAEDADCGELQQAVSDFMAKDSVLRERRSKQYDLRALIEELKISSTAPCVLEMTGALSPEKGAARPDELLDELGTDPLRASVHRTAIYYHES